MIVMMVMMMMTIVMTMMIITIVMIFSITVTLLHRLFFGFFVNYLFVHHFVVYLLIQSTVLPFLLSYDFISLNFKTRPKITSLVCLVFAARKECIRPWIDDPAQQAINTILPLSMSARVKISYDTKSGLFFRWTSCTRTRLVMWEQRF